MRYGRYQLHLCRVAYWLGLAPPRGRFVERRRRSFGPWDYCFYCGKTCKPDADGACGACGGMGSYEGAE